MPTDGDAPANPFDLWRSSAWRHAAAHRRRKRETGFATDRVGIGCARADLDRVQSKVAHLLACSPRMRTGGDAPWGDLAGQAGWTQSTTTSIPSERRPSTPGSDPIGQACLRGAPQPGYAGSGSKIARPGGSTTDFLLQTEKDHNVAGLINLFGILVGAPGHDRQRFLPQSLRLPRRLPQARPHPMLEFRDHGRKHVRNSMGTLLSRHLQRAKPSAPCGAKRMLFQEISAVLSSHPISKVLVLDQQRDCVDPCSFVIRDEPYAVTQAVAVWWDVRRDHR